MASKRPEDAEPLDPLTEEALAWLVRLHSGEETAQDWVDYENWKAGSAERRQAAARAEGLWEKLGPALVRGRDRKGRRIPTILLVAIALAAMAFASGVFGPPDSYFADQRTAMGEQRSVTLSDGSQVDLDTGTSLDVDVEGAERTLTLYSGQIFVAVKSDPARPFIVRTRNGTVRALGTALSVRHDGDVTTVVVTENVVRVAFPNEAAGQTADVSQGQEVSYAPETGLISPRPVDLHAANAWRQGRMIFDRRSLGEVVAEMSRYRRGKILITNAATSRLAVTGVFSTGDPDALLDAISVALPVSVLRLPFLTLIQPDPDRSISRTR